MKLFFFNPNDYGAEFSVMSDSEERALECVKEHLLAEAKENPTYSFYMDKYNEWKDATVDSLPEEYSIEVFEKNSVIETEYG